MNARPRILVAGIGNIFLGDDGFGCAVAGRLAEQQLPGHVRVHDFGTRVLDLAFEMTAGWDAAILLDLSARGGAPGTLYLLDPRPDVSAMPPPGHALQLEPALALARRLGNLPALVRILGCEPSTDGCAELNGLSPAVADAVLPAARMVEALVAELGGACHA
ncbi:MAG: hydrogenase maturation protease [Nevskia sp.]|nr:hydrogenase maturation protease [Nevskia sp.]